MLREYFWSLTFVAIVLAMYTLIVWQHRPVDRQPATAVGSAAPTAPTAPAAP